MQSIIESESATEEHPFTEEQQREWDDFLQLLQKNNKPFEGLGT